MERVLLSSKEFDSFPDPLFLEIKLHYCESLNLKCVRLAAGPRTSLELVNLDRQDLPPYHHSRESPYQYRYLYQSD